MPNKKITVLVILCSLWLSTPVTSQMLVEVVTESTPFTRKGNAEAFNGESTVFVEKILSNAGINYDIAFVPWKRSFLYAKRAKNVLIYPIAKTQPRLDQFIWIGKIIPVKYYLFKLKSRTDFTLSNIEQAKHLKIGVVNDHAHHEYLHDKGFANIQIVNNSTQNLHKLLKGRIDLFPLSSGGLEPLCKKAAIDCSLLEPALALEDFSDGLYLAYGLNTDQKIIDATRSSHGQLINSEFYQQLFATRLDSARQFEKTWHLNQPDLNK